MTSNKSRYGQTDILCVLSIITVITTVKPAFWLASLLGVYFITSISCYCLYQSASPWVMTFSFLVYSLRRKILVAREIGRAKNGVWVQHFSKLLLRRLSCLLAKVKVHNIEHEEWMENDGLMVDRLINELMDRSIDWWMAGSIDI